MAMETWRRAGKLAKQRKLAGREAGLCEPCLDGKAHHGTPTPETDTCCAALAGRVQRIAWPLMERYDTLM